MGDAILLGAMDVPLDILQAGIGARRDPEPDAGRHRRFLGDRVGDASPGDARHVGRGGRQHGTATRDRPGQGHQQQHPNDSHSAASAIALPDQPFCSSFCQDSSASALGRFSQRERAMRPIR
jgi:hypothetical protein